MLCRMPGYDSRYWADRTANNRRRAYGAFRGQATADVVVSGGGLRGCAAAFELSRAGLDVVLLEADRLASGATAGGLGVLLPQPDGQYAAIERVAGRRAARVAWQEAQRGAREL